MPAPTQLTEIPLLRMGPAHTARDAMSTPITDDALPAAAPAPSPFAAPRPPRRRRQLWLPLLVVGVVAASAAWVWQQQARLLSTVTRQQNLIERLAQGVSRMETQVDRLDTRQADLAGAAQRNSVEIAEFGQRIAEHDQIVGNLNEQMAGGRNRFQLNAIENLLLLANDRLLIARDVKAALVALQEADERIGALRDPRLFNVREAIARERAGLQAVPMPDYTGAALQLASLAGRAERLPLRARAPDHFEAAPLPAPTPAADLTRWQRLRAAVGEALRGMFTLRRSSGPAARLLAPQEEALVHQVLMLRIEAARVALLRSDSVSFRDACSSAARWLRDWYRVDDSSVQTALAELERLQPLELAPPLPDITRSLTLLRAHMDVPAQ